MKRFLRAHGLSIFAIAWVLAFVAIGHYNSGKFKAKCTQLGGVPVRDVVCVRPGSVIEVPR